MKKCKWCNVTEIKDHLTYCKPCRPDAYKCLSRVACRKKRGYDKPTTSSGIDPKWLVRGTISTRRYEDE